MGDPIILVTGCAGFIGYHLTQRLIGEGHRVIGIDNICPYYDVSLKRARLLNLVGSRYFRFVEGSICDRSLVQECMQMGEVDTVINLAAQAGVRYSLINPQSYIETNLEGFSVILEMCRQFSVKHLVYASSSSVYGANALMPFSVHNGVDHPMSLYAATKRANELMAHAYSNLFWLPTTGLRFFTVYGPWGRPDMALFSFTKSILTGEPIQVFNEGHMKRDFTYVDDIVEAIYRVSLTPPRADPQWSSLAPDPATSYCPYRIYNIGSQNPIGLTEFIDMLEECLGKRAIKEYLPMQLGDVMATYADVSDLTADTGFKPTTSVRDGVRQFVEWYKTYYGVDA